MALEIPNTAVEIDNRARTDIQRELITSNPQLKNSALLGLITAYSNRIFDFYLQLLEAIKQSFPDTATEAFLEQWAAIFGKQRIAATSSAGNCIASGTASSVIPLSTSLVISDKTYTTISSATISVQSVSVASVNGIVLSGTTATVTTISDHNLSNNIPVTITGAVEPEYNLTDTDITVTGFDTFEYQVSGSPDTPASGTILIGFTSASVSIQSDEFGIDQNLDTGSLLRLQSPIAGVDDSLGVDFGAISGGTDQELDDSLRTRTLDKIQNPVAHFNVSDITDKAKEVAGVTRVFINEAGSIIGSADITSITRSGTVATVILTVAQDLNSGQLVTITGAIEGDYNVTDAPILVENTTVFHYVVANDPDTPATGTIISSLRVPIGTVEVFFMRDNDANPIPSGSAVLEVNDKILEILPANTDGNSDLGVFSPTAVQTDYSFSELSPNTQTLKDAIIENLKVFYAEKTSVGVDVDEDAYRSAIFNTIDTETGDVVLTFELSSPTSDIVISLGQIGTLGNVTFT